MKCDKKKKYEADDLACERLQETVEPLVEWFRENQRDLPWRKHVNAYRVWISEIMLQQTRVEAVKSYYTRFLGELPDIKALAEVPEIITAADVSPDGSRLAVLSYGAILIHARDPATGWAQAAANPPQRIPIPLVPKAEALTWSASGGGLYVTGEFSQAPIFHVIP